MRLALFFISSLAFASPCMTATRACMEKVPLSESGYFWIYRSQPLTQIADGITRVYILVHGVRRDGNNYYRTAIRATEEAGEMSRTLVIAPQFHATDGKCDDKPDRGETIFPCHAWSDGASAQNAPFSSFSAL